MQYNMIRQQIKQSEESKSQLLDTITTMKENDQKKALIELEKKNKESLKLQKQEFANREKERLAFVKIQSERLEVIFHLCNYHFKSFSYVMISLNKDLIFFRLKKQ